MKETKQNRCIIHILRKGQLKRLPLNFLDIRRLAKNILVKNISDSNVYMLGISLLKCTSSINCTLTFSFSSVRDPLFWRISDLAYSSHLKFKKTDPRSLKVFPKSQNCLNSREGPDLGPFGEKRFSRLSFPTLLSDETGSFMPHLKLPIINWRLWLSKFISQSLSFCI